MRIIKRIEVGASLSKIEADLFNDLNQLVDHINDYHLQHSKWLEDDFLANQKKLTPAEYSKQKLVSLLLKRQVAERDKIIAIASDTNSPQHQAFIKEHSDAPSAKLALLKKEMRGLNREIYLLRRESEHAATQHAEYLESYNKAVSKLKRVEKKLSRDPGNPELTAELAKVKKRHSTNNIAIDNIELHYKNIQNQLTILCDKQSADLREIEELAVKLSNLQKKPLALVAEVEAYAQLLHLTAVELAVVAKLTDQLILAVNVTKKTAAIYPGTLSEEAAETLENFYESVIQLHISILDYMLIFAAANKDHRDNLFANGTLNSRGIPVSNSENAVTLDPLDIPGLENTTFKLYYTTPIHIDPLYFIKKEINAFSRPNYFTLAHILLPDTSYVDEMPATILRGNSEVDARSSVKRYFDWYREQSESGAFTANIQCRIDATEVVDPQEIDQLSFFADHNGHSAISAIVNRTNVLIDDLYHEMSKRWKAEFIAQCNNIEIKRPFAALATKPNAPKVSAAQAAAKVMRIEADNDHVWDIIPSPRAIAVAQTKENHRNLFLYEIGELLAQLSAEIAAHKKLAQATISHFFKDALQRKIEGKEEKRKSLVELSKAPTLDDLAKAAAVLSQNPKVVEGFKSRTHTLLMNIIEKANQHHTLRPLNQH